MNKSEALQTAHDLFFMMGTHDREFEQMLILLAEPLELVIKLQFPQSQEEEYTTYFIETMKDFVFTRSSEDKSEAVRSEIRFMAMLNSDLLFGRNRITHPDTGITTHPFSDKVKRYYIRIRGNSAQLALSYKRALNGDFRSEPKSIGEKPETILIHDEYGTVENNTGDN